MPEADIEAVSELPHLKDLKDASKSDVKVTRGAARASRRPALAHQRSCLPLCRGGGILQYTSAPDVLTSPSRAQELLSQTAVLKLNGGLGTSMGLEKAKSLLEVKDGKTFLDLIAEQIKYTRKQFGSKARAQPSTCRALLAARPTLCSSGTLTRLKHRPVTGGRADGRRDARRSASC